MTTKQRYTQLDPISHIIKRPDMYCGSVKFRESHEYTYVDDRVTKTKISTCPALLRIFVEVLSNAIDNAQRSSGTSEPCKKIKIDVDAATGMISIWNDGQVIPIEINNDTHMYNHTMIFGQLLTGSNYDDTEDRVVAGRNGLGSKLCNVFSSTFVVEGCDPVNHKTIRQVWTGNMRHTDGPVVKTKKCKKGFTKISWIPDFKLFGITEYPPSILDMYRKYITDASLVSKLPLYYNDACIKIGSLRDYARLFTQGDESGDRLVIKTDTCDVFLCPRPDGETFDHVSFVNGNYTRLGGVHVDGWSEAIFRPIVDYINGKVVVGSAKKRHKINISDVKQFFRLFLVSTLVRPEFDGQDKHRLESPDVKTEVTPSIIKKVLKWAVIDKIKNILRSKEVLTTVKKGENSRIYQKIDGYDRANNAGGRRSSECTLIICEGLSAKTYAVAGINKGLYGKKGRDWFGILPLTGKLLNVKNASTSSINSNKVVSNLISVIGAKYNVDYASDNVKSLNYGKILIMTDADHDGIHIEGLIINLINTLFPSLLARSSPFIISMKTPIARITFKNKKMDDKLFYDEHNFNNWLAAPASDPYTVKYYKGLGTTKIEDVADTFGSKMVSYDWTEDTNSNIDKIFHRDFTDERKRWIGSYTRTGTSFSLDNVATSCVMHISDFMCHEMIKFSLADCQRSIPCLIDGFKESQRKILFCVKKRNLKYNGTSLKVAQLSGYTAEHSNYHHGEQNLHDTIISMANDFVGSNNIPLLYRDGQFGTRLDGGSDAASARYIYTKMDVLTEFIFRHEDDPILTYKFDDGDRVEPEFYAPIIPMILVNGSVGIGTGWSSNIPSYNPLDLIAAIKQWLTYKDDDCVVYDDNRDIVVSMFDEIHPWYRNFKGSIQLKESGKYITRGVSEVTNNKVVVTELPIGAWTNKFKERCEDLIISKRLKSMKNYSLPTTPNFVIEHVSSDAAVISKDLKLDTSLSTSNMVAFSVDGQITKYNSPDAVIDHYCGTRYAMYTKRKMYQIDKIDSDIRILRDRITFINLFLTREIDMVSSTDDHITVMLKKLKVNEIDGSYNFLFDMPIRSLTKTKVDGFSTKLGDLRAEKTEIENKSETAMWLSDLTDLEREYNKVYK